MQKFEGISFVWALAFVALGLVFFGCQAVLGYRRVAQDAKEDFKFKFEKDMIDDRVSESGYIRAYKRFYAPRGKAYATGALAAVLILTAPAFALINVILYQIWSLTGNDDIYAPNFMVGQFITFFLIITFWVLIIYIAMREYHRRAPVSFKRELIREYGQS